MKKWILRIITPLLPCALVSVVYFSVPGEIILPENARYSAYPNGFVRYDNSGEAKISTETLGTSEVRATLFGALPLKTVQVSVVPQQYVNVSGEAIGIRIYAGAVLVIDTEPDGAARRCGLKSGDLITKINNEPITSVEQLGEKIQNKKQNLVTFVRGGKSRTAELVGDEKEKGYTAGMWIRDSAAGIGTMSFCDNETKVFGALGHAICDSDTGDIIPLWRGSVSDCRISAVKAGAKGEPGELMGAIGTDEYGEVRQNSELGLYGILKRDVPGEPIPVATRFLVKEGSAKILCDVDGGGVKAYNIEIEQVSQKRASGNKSMTIRVTDPDLLAKTGGIVQGMSGAPIIQAGKIAGAVTHVFVNDPTRGYGIFIESMLAEVEKIK